MLLEMWLIPKGAFSGGMPMNRIKRFCLIVYGLAGVLCLCGLALPWVGPFQSQATDLMKNNIYFVIMQIALAITGLGVIVTLLRGILMPRQEKTVVIEETEEDSISVSTKAITSQARHIIEDHGDLDTEDVSVNTKRRGLSVDVRVKPQYTVNVVDEGRRLRDDLELGLSYLCGDKVKHINIEFVEPDPVLSAQDVSIELLEAQDVYERAALSSGFDTEIAALAGGFDTETPTLADGTSESHEDEGEGE